MLVPYLVVNHSSRLPARRLGIRIAMRLSITCPKLTLFCRFVANVAKALVAKLCVLHVRADLDVVCESVRLGGAIGANVRQWIGARDRDDFEFVVRKLDCFDFRFFLFNFRFNFCFGGSFLGGWGSFV